MTELSDDAFVKLERIGALLSEVSRDTPDGDGADLVLDPAIGVSSRCYDPVPPKAALHKMVDLNTMIWTFGILEVTELTWVASQMRPLLKGYSPAIRSPSDVD